MLDCQLSCPRDWFLIGWSSVPADRRAFGTAQVDTPNRGKIHACSTYQPTKMSKGLTQPSMQMLLLIPWSHADSKGFRNCWVTTSRNWPGTDWGANSGPCGKGTVRQICPVPGLEAQAPRDRTQR